MTVSLIRFLIFTFLLVNVAPAQSQRGKLQRQRTLRAPSTSITNERWYKFTSPDKDFVIEFQYKPERMADSEAPSGTARNYALIRNSIIFQLSYVDTGIDAESRNSNQFPLKFSQEMIEHAIQSRGADVLRSRLLHINVYEIEILSPRKGDRSLMLHSIERYVIRYGRQYTLSCSSIIPNKRVNAITCQRFFNSFRVVGIPQPH